jgi:glutamyl-tRNA reductase
MDMPAPKVLVVGTGKFGRNVCKNLLEYLPASSLTICNRTLETALGLAGDLKAEVLPFEDLPVAINGFDVIIVSTSAAEPVVLKKYMNTAGKKFIVDLSVPVNVEPSVGDLEGITLANVDDISAILDRTIERRKLEIPKAEAIIAAFKSDFYNWLHTYKHAPAIRHIKQQLTDLGRSRSHGCELANEASLSQVYLNELVQETVNNLVVNLKTGGEKGCQFIEAYQRFLNHPAVATVPLP